MATAESTELVDRFEEFYRTYYRNEIGELAQKYPSEQRSLYVNWNDLYQFDPDLAEDYQSQPGQLQEYAEEALRVYELPIDVGLGQAHVRIDLNNPTEIREIRAHHRGQLLSVRGIVRKATDVRPKIQEAAFECQRCGTLTRIPQTGGDFQEPHECQGCERQGPFEINFDQSEFVDAQKLRVQESPEGLRGGETPQNIDIHIEDDITGEVTAGDHVRTSGILHLDQQDDGQSKSPIFDVYMDGLTVEIEDEQFEDMDITEADKGAIVELSSEPDIYEQMVASIAPSIYGYDQEKLAMLLQLFSGVTKHLPDESRIRGDMHLLFIGDPGTGKCVAGDTKVTLADGSERAIGEIVESNLDDPVPVDDGVYGEVDFRVPSLDSDGRLTHRRARKVWKREAPAEMYRIRTASGKEIEVTPSHPLFVQREDRFEGVKAADLGEGQFVATPRRIPTEGDDTLDIEYRDSRSPNAVRLNLPEEWTPRLARLVGYVIAEGHVVLSDDHTGDVRITNNDREILEDVTDAFEGLGLNYTERASRPEKSAREIMCTSGEFASFLAALEPSILERSAQQRVPDALMRASPTIKSAFVKALVESEGHVSTTEREIAVGSTSFELLDGVRSLLLALGIGSQLRERAGGSFRLRISGTDFERYVEEVGFVTDRKSVASRAFDGTNSNTNTDVVANVGETLQRIREALALSQSACGLPRSTYQHYERGDRNPGRESLHTALTAFEARLEFLRERKRRIENGNGGWDAIETVRGELSISQRRLADGIGVTQTAISYYDCEGVVPDGGRVRGAKEVVLDRIDDALAVEDTIERLRAVAGSDVAWDRIESIEPIEPTDEWVYDLEIEGTHNYLTNNVLSHNSQLLQYIRHIAPRSVYTSGKGSSSAGLTAAAVRDDFGDGQQWTLEAGALVLADRGIAAVDEIDKMRPEDRSAMHEALEQQSYHPNSEILLANGHRVEIGEFVDERMADRPDDVIDGMNCEVLPIDDERVHSVDFEANETTKRSIDRVSRHEAPEEFVRVQFSNGRDVLVTPEHPMFVAGEDDIGTVEAREVEPGAFVPAPRKLPNSGASVALQDESHVGTERDVSLPDELSEDLAEILGLLIAEGHSYAGSSHEIGFSNQDEQLLNRAATLVGDVFDLESTDTTNAAGTITKRWISTKLYRWFERNFPEVMGTAREKRVPARVLGASEEHIRRFLVGAFAGDGSVESKAMALSTASAGLAEDYADALAKLGVASRLHHDDTEDAWKTYVMGDSVGRFVEEVVEPADDRYERATAFAERSSETPRHHDVLPTGAARELRALRKLVGLGLTGRFRAHLDEKFGVQVATVERQLASIRDRITEVRNALDMAADLADVRAAIDWSGRELADRLDGMTSSGVHYAEGGGYDAAKRKRLAERARLAVRAALEDAEHRADALESQCALRYYRVTDVETVPNDGEFATDWAYDVTVEPTNTFVSQGVALHNSISVSKAGINATLKSRCSLLAAANPKYGRFDRYESVGEQIDLEPALISRFDLIFTVTDEPDPEEDANLADHILRTNYAGELNTQRTRMTAANVSQKAVDAATEEVAPTIDPDLLRKYIAYAKREVFPTMTEEAREAIRDFYVDLRAQGAGEDAPVPVTARKLEALVRLAEASARVRLSDAVELEDAERVIGIVRSCLKDIGVDPETGEFDADVVETGTSKSQRDRIKNIKALIEDVGSEYDEGAPVDEVLGRADEVDLDREKAEHEIEQLKRKGEVYEPRTDHLRTT
jgi:replicative DNA helicase Mcm